MIRMKGEFLKGNVKFEKRKQLFIGINPLRSKGVEIKRKLDMFRDSDVDSFTIQSEAFMPHTLKVEKNGDNTYTLSLTKPIKVQLNHSEYLKLEDLLTKMADQCTLDPNTLIPSNSSSCLLNNGNETPRST
jgi:hypothetical protein